MYKRPTFLCRRSNDGRHDLVVAFPEASGTEAADRFLSERGIESCRRLSADRIAFTLGDGPVLRRLVWEAFSGQMGGYPVVRALLHPEIFPGEVRGTDRVGETPGQPVPTSTPTGSPGRPGGPARRPVGAVLAVGVSFLLGTAAASLLRAPDPAPAGAGPEAVVTADDALVPVDLGDFVAALGPAAAFRAEDGSLRYALAAGSLEGRLSPATQLRVESGIAPALLTPVRELRDADGAFVFDRPVEAAEVPPLDAYAGCPEGLLAADTAWETAEDSTLALYRLREEWRRIGSRRVKLEGRLELDRALLRVGPVAVRLVEMDQIDHLNASLGSRGSGRITVYGTLADELPWQDVRFDPTHPVFSLRVDWIDPGTPGLLCRAEGV